jgi:hypothetical protein
MSQHVTPAPSCSLDGRAFQERVAAIAAFHARALVRQQRVGRRLILTYADESGPQVADMVARERDCCAFLDFGIDTTKAGVVLTITVPEGHADNADALLAPFDGSHAKATASCCGTCR